MITSLKLPTIPRFFSWSVKSAVWYPCSPRSSAVCFIASAADLEAVLLESNYCFGLVSLTILLILLPLKSLLLCVIAAAAVLDPLMLLESNYCCHRWVKPPRRSLRVCWVFSSETQDTCIRLFLTLLLITVFLFSPVFKSTAPALTLSVARRSVNSCVRALKSVRLCYLDLGATRLAKRGPPSGNCKLHELYKYK